MAVHRRQSNIVPSFPGARDCRSHWVAPRPCENCSKNFLSLSISESFLFLSLSLCIYFLICLFVLFGPYLSLSLSISFFFIFFPALLVVHAFSISFCLFLTLSDSFCLFLSLSVSFCLFLSLVRQSQFSLGFQHPRTFLWYIIHAADSP